MIVSNRAKNIKKYWITFVVALSVALIIIAIFVLAIGGRKTNWITKNSGIGRENIFPYAFTCENGLFIATNENTILPVDTETSNEQFDADLKKLYYVQNEKLYEYDLSKNYRKALLEGVLDYKLFAERTAIVCTGVGGELLLYQYNEKDSESLCQYFGKDNENIAIGENLFVYKYQNGDKYELAYCTIEGEKTILSQDLSKDSRFFVFKNDRAVVYETASDVEIYNVKANKTVTLENAKLVCSNDAANDDYFGELVSVEEFGDFENVKYVIRNMDENGLGELSYIKFENRNISVASVAASVSPEYIVNFDEDDGIVVYAKGKDIYYSKDGSKPKLIATVTDAATVYFDPAGNKLFVNENDSVYYVNIFDRTLTKNKVFDGKALLFDSYPNKEICAVFSDTNEIYYVLSGNRIEKNDFGETRLYGNSETKYIQLRLVNNGHIRAIDFVDGTKYVRICSNAEFNIAFDKKLENILYESNGELILYSNGENKSLGKYEGIESVTTLAKIK